MSILDRIVAVKRAEVAAAKKSLSSSDLQRRAEAAAPSRDFVAALKNRIAAGKPAVIAEIKRASPSKGLLREDFEPADIARSYEAGGAACLSVLTDREFFRGAPEHLQAARTACALPALRKDFVIDPYQVLEARAMGADCILLIAACLALRRDERARGARSAARHGGAGGSARRRRARRGARSCERSLIGINNRDLRTFHTRLETTLDLLQYMPDGRIVVTESGIASAEDVQRLRRHGVNAFLVGEAFMRAPDPGAALRELLLPA